MKTSTTVLVILLLAILSTAGGAFYVLEEGHQAVILQFGRPVGNAVTEAGLHFKLPFIQEVRRFDKRLLIWDGDPNQIPTEGREFIWVDSTARWRIVDPLKFLENVATEAGAQSRLDDIIDSVVRDLVSANPLVELVRSSTWTTPKGEVLEEASKEVVEELKRKSIWDGKGSPAPFCPKSARPHPNMELKWSMSALNGSITSKACARKCTHA